MWRVGIIALAVLVTGCASATPFGPGLKSGRRERRVRALNADRRRGERGPAGRRRAWALEEYYAELAELDES